MEIASVNMGQLPNGKVALNARVTFDGVEVGRIFAKTNSIAEAYQIVSEFESDPTSSQHYYPKSTQQ